MKDITPHTPGPWKATTLAVFTTQPDERSKHLGGMQCIAQIADGWDGPEGIANARLIASAPELLDMVVKLSCNLVHCMTTHWTEDAQKLWDDSSALIVKATLGEPAQ